MNPTRILIVDDEAAIRFMLLRMLEPLHHEVTLAEDGQSAHDLIREQEFDLIIADLKMPRMDGMTLLERIREEGHDAAFILLTAHGDLSQALQARERFNISHFMTKPIHSMGQFLFDVESAISRRRLERENRSLMESLQEINSALECKVRERTRKLSEKNEELRRLSNFRADVLKVLGHELRTPLAVLSGFFHLAKQGGPDSFLQFAPRIGGSIDRLHQKIEKALLLLKGSERTQFPLELEWVDPHALCRAMVERIGPFVASRGIEIVPPAGGSSLHCRWDREKLEDVVEELLVNAVRASPDHARIEMALSREGNWITLEVADRGVGMPEEQLARVFEPFVTLGKAEHHKSGLFEFGAKGIGIGLSTARMWVRLHGGTLSARRNHPAPGVTFRCRLPDSCVMEEQARAERTAGSAPLPARPSNPNAHS